MKKHSIKILDKKAQKDFEKLLGFSINGNYIEIPHRVYIKYFAKINIIQLESAMRNKNE